MHSLFAINTLSQQQADAAGQGKSDTNCTQQLTIKKTTQGFLISSNPRLQRAETTLTCCNKEENWKMALERDPQHDTLIYDLEISFDNVFLTCVMPGVQFHDMHLTIFDVGSFIS